ELLAVVAERTVPTGRTLEPQVVWSNFPVVRIAARSGSQRREPLAIKSIQPFLCCQIDIARLVFLDLHDAVMRQAVLYGVVGQASTAVTIGSFSVAAEPEVAIV